VGVVRSPIEPKHMIPAYERPLGFHLVPAQFWLSSRLAGTSFGARPWSRLERHTRGMRIGLLSDVHGNLSGLRAVAAALEREGPLDAVVVAGDHLGAGPRPREAWEELNALGWTLVRGNDDEE